MKNIRCQNVEEKKPQKQTKNRFKHYCTRINHGMTHEKAINIVMILSNLNLLGYFLEETN